MKLAPISLTNTDFKILARYLKLRMSVADITVVVDSIVHKDQHGFIKGRSVSSEIRLIDDTH